MAPHTRVIAATYITLAASFGVFAQKMEPAEIAARHRASIGSPSALAAVKNQIILSEARFTFKGSTNLIAGKFVLLTTHEKSLFGMNFTSNDYPQDRFGFDGRNVRVGKATPSSRSLIGDFLDKNRSILRDGLLGGTLSASWALLDENLRGAKLKNQGTRSIDGKEAIILSYEPKGSSDVSIKLFFDSKSFDHIRTEYTLVRAAAQGSNIDNSAGQSGAVFRIVEDFSKFTRMGDLKLPASYKITYSRSGTADVATQSTTNRDAEWSFSVTDFGINRELDAGAFEIEAR